MKIRKYNAFALCLFLSLALLAASCSDTAEPDAEPDDQTPSTAADPPEAPQVTSASALSSNTLSPTTNTPSTTSSPAEDAISENSPFPSIAAGSHHSCALHGNGTVSCWGRNQKGQLGATGNTADLKKVDGIADAKAIAAGNDHSCAVRGNGEAWCWGRNFDGQLGNGQQADSLIPVQAREITDATDITAGIAHTCSLRKSGSISCWGWNSSGQLGNGQKGEAFDDSSADSAIPVPVAGITDAVVVRAGWLHTCSLHEDGSVSCWGYNWVGILGNGESSDPQDDHSADSAVPVEVIGIDDAIDIAAGRNHTCALHQDGTISCWGHNYYGQLGNGRYRYGADSSVPVKVSSIDDATAVAAGSDHTCALRTDGTVLCWGDNESQQLGRNHTRRSSRLPVQVEGITDVKDISAGNFHTCALHRDGAVSCWGSDARIGLDSEDSRIPGIAQGTAVRSGDRHTCVLHEDGTITCWGSNDFGQLGILGISVFFEDSAMPMTVTGITDALQITAGDKHTCALRREKTVSCWGAYGSYLVAQFIEELLETPFAGSPTPSQINDITGAASVASGGDHFCALHEDGAISCWGPDDYNSFGYPASLQSDAARRIQDITDATAITAGKRHTCALHEGGAISCWGSNDFGMLGNEDAAEEFTEYSPVPVKVENINDATAIAAGSLHTCALHEDGTVSCWGQNWYGQLGSGTLRNLVAPEKVAGITDATAIAAGGSHTCALQEGGVISCWGNNDQGQLGISQSLRLSAVPMQAEVAQDAYMLAAGSSHTCALLEEGSITCWGDNTYGQLGEGRLFTP